MYIYSLVCPLGSRDGNTIPQSRLQQSRSFKTASDVFVRKESKAMCLLGRINSGRYGGPAVNEDLKNRIVPPRADPQRLRPFHSTYRIARGEKGMRCNLWLAVDTRVGLF